MYARTNSLKGTIKGRTIASGVHDSRAARYDGHVEQLKKKHAFPLAENHIPRETLLLFFMSSVSAARLLQFWESDEEFRRCSSLCGMKTSLIICGLRRCIT